MTKTKKIIIPSNAEYTRPRLGIEALNAAINSAGLDLSSEIHNFSLDQPTIKQSDAILFSLASPLEYKLLLDYLKFHDIPLETKNRETHHPLVLGGGMGFSNPETLSSFFDIIIHGPSYIPLLESLPQILSSSRGFELERLASLPNLYVPNNFQFEFNSNGSIKSISGISNFERRNFQTPFPISQQVSDTEALLIPELGCRNNCYFCELTNFFDYTETDSCNLNLEIKRLSRSGIRKVKIVSAHAFQHSKINEFLDCINSEGLDVEIGSVRIDNMTHDILERLRKGHRTNESSFLYRIKPKNNGRAITFGIECGSDRLLSIINKGFNLKKVRDRIQRAVDYGITNFGLYFLVGLPTETEEDLKGISDIVSDAFNYVRLSQGEIYVSINPFIPSPNTPMQRCPIVSMGEYFQKLEAVKLGVIENIGTQTFQDNIHYSYLNPGTFLFETVTMRGDRRVGRFIESLYKDKVNLETLSEGEVKHYLSHLNLPDLDFYRRSIPLTEFLPWEKVKSEKVDKAESHFLSNLGRNG